MTCKACGNKGLIRINYHSGEPFSIAMCQCEKGRFFRLAGEAFVRHWLAKNGEDLALAHLIDYREHLDIDDEPAAVVERDVTAAGAKVVRPKGIR